MTEMEVYFFIGILEILVSDFILKEKIEQACELSAF